MRRGWLPRRLNARPSSAVSHPILSARAVGLLARSGRHDDQRPVAHAGERLEPPSPGRRRSKWRRLLTHRATSLAMSGRVFEPVTASASHPSSRLAGKSRGRPNTATGIPADVTVVPRPVGTGPRTYDPSMRRLNGRDVAKLVAVAAPSLAPRSRSGRTGPASTSSTVTSTASASEQPRCGRSSTRAVCPGHLRAGRASSESSGRR